VGKISKDKVFKFSRLFFSFLKLLTDMHDHIQRVHPEKEEKGK